MDATIIPPKAGIAIGIIISAPLPVEVSTGNSAIMVVAEVIIAGFILLFPAFITAVRTSSFVVVLFFSQRVDLMY